MIGGPERGETEPGIAGHYRALMDARPLQRLPGVSVLGAIKLLQRPYVMKINRLIEVLELTCADRQCL